MPTPISTQTTMSYIPLSADDTVTYYSPQTIEASEQAYFAQGHEAYTLMCQAGQACFDLLRQQIGQTPQNPMAIFIGIGGNGGDAWVVARLALQAQWPVVIYTLQSITQWQSSLSMLPLKAAQLAYRDFCHANQSSEHPCKIFDTLPDDFTQQSLSWIIDGLFGIGLKRPIEGVAQQWILSMNQHLAPKLAIDIPSGLHAYTGMPLPISVRADITLTMIAPKIGLANGLAADVRGKLYCAPLGVPVISGDHNILQQQTVHSVQRDLPLTHPAAHKGERGHTLIIGGGAGMSGALQLAATACLQSGSGRVTAWCEQEMASCAMAANAPEIMFNFHKKNHHLIDEALISLSPTVLALGPGLGQGQWGQLMAQLLPLWITRSTQCPLVMDADALNWLSTSNHYCDHWVLTPHPGEAARLLQTTTQVIMADRLQAIKAIQKRYGGIVLLKGSFSLCFDGEHLSTCAYGSPAMATSGLGDLLTGIIAALIAQGMPLFLAAQTAMVLHAKAGEIASDGHVRGLMARALLSPLTKLLNDFYHEID